MPHGRAAPLLAATLMVVTACSVTADSAGPGASSPETATAPTSEELSALDDRFDVRLPEPIIDPADLRLGAPADAIPAIDQPAFETAESVDWLDPGEPVLSLTVDGATRAYPLRVMTWHEIVNDTVADVPVAVTYCPLCNSGVAFLREVEGRVLSFGTSGLLLADNLVMYDRQTESLWPQLTGQASVGVLTGQRLDAIPMGTVSWKEFRRAHPRSLVLSQRTGFERPYGGNPYVGYDDPDGDLLFELPRSPDARLPVKERVLGIAVGSSSVAVVRSGLVDRVPFDITVGGRRLTVWHSPGQRSALGAPSLAGGAEIGSVAVFDPVLDGRPLHFSRGKALFVDEETGSRWDILGRGVSGPLRGKRLRLQPHLDTFWFAWAAFHRDTDLVDPRDAGRR